MHMSQRFYDNIVATFYEGNPDHKLLKLSASHGDVFADPFEP